MIIPKCLPGQILIRNEDDEWVCVWPDRTYCEKWFIGFVTMVCVALFVIAGALLWVSH